MYSLWSGMDILRWILMKEVYFYSDLDREMVRPHYPRKTKTGRQRQTVPGRMVAFVCVIELYIRVCVF